MIKKRKYRVSKPTHKEQIRSLLEVQMQALSENQTEAVSEETRPNTSKLLHGSIERTRERRHKDSGKHRRLHKSKESRNNRESYKLSKKLKKDTKETRDRRGKHHKRIK